MHLAELNVGRLLAPIDDPRVADFMDNLDRINGLGKRMPGFVWLMEGAGGAGNTDNAIGGDPQYVPNLSVWETPADLEHFVFNTLHKKFFERRADWFEVMEMQHFVMWWVPNTHRPTIDEALTRLDHLRDNGETEHAFGWAHLRKTGHLTGGDQA